MTSKYLTPVSRTKPNLLVKRRWITVPQTDNFITPRRNHSCCIFSKFMLVHGGLDHNDVPINDFWIFNCEKLVWHSPNIDTYSDLPHLSHHDCAPVFSYPHRINDIYSKKSFIDQKDKVIFPSDFYRGFFMKVFTSSEGRTPKGGRLTSFIY